MLQSRLGATVAVWSNCVAVTVGGYSCSFAVCIFGIYTISGACMPSTSTRSQCNYRLSTHPRRHTIQQNPLARASIAKSKRRRTKKRQTGGRKTETKAEPLKVVAQVEPRPEREGPDNISGLADIAGDENESNYSSPNLDHSDGLSLDQPVADTARGEIERVENDEVSEEVGAIAKPVIDDEKDQDTEMVEAVRSPAVILITTKNVKEEQPTTVEPEAEVKIQSEERKQTTTVATTQNVQFQPSPNSTTQS